MGEQALQAIRYLAESGPATLGSEPNVIGVLKSRGIIVQADNLANTWKLTSYGRGALRQIDKAGVDAMIQKMESFL